MAGIEKYFDGTKEGLQRLKEFLMRERLPQRNDLKMYDANAMDLDAGFQAILKAHKDKKMAIDKENMSPSFGNTTLTNKTISASTSSMSQTTIINHNDSSILLDSTFWRQDNDESFNKIEKMCDKTASDPDSTLFHYMSNLSKSIDTTVTEESLKNNIGKTYFGDQTQLNDIEEPSGLWENTLVGDTSGVQTSPVKMVAHLRPSTIMEESSFISDGNSSTTSFKSAQRLNETLSSGNYETAHESIKTNRPPSPSLASLLDESNNEELIGSYVSKSNSEILDFLPPKKRTFYDDIDPSTNSLQSTRELISNEESVSSKSDKGNKTLSDISSLMEDSLNISAELRRMNATNSIMEDSLNLPKKSYSSKTSDYTDSNKESSDECDLINLNESLHPKNDVHRKKISYDDSLIEISDDDDEDNCLNRSFSIQEDKDDDHKDTGINVSQEFNNTDEEIEYIMQQGMKYMTETNKSAIHSAEKKTPSYLKSPATYSTGNITPIQSYIKSPATPNTVISKPLRTPVIDNTFKKPVQISSSRIPQSKGLLFHKKNSEFSHIVSPVGVYIHNTGKTPMMSVVKPSHDSKAIRELDYEAKNTPPRKLCEPSTSKKVFSSLPKKAYISSEYKYVMDERSPISIPGGETIHRYLHSTKGQTVIRHEGKIKMNMIPGCKSQENPDDANKTVDSSLADLSVMSGDVSVHVLKDAKILKH